MTETSRKKGLQRFFIIASGFAFLGMMTIPLLSGMLESSKTTANSSPNGQTNATENKQAQQIIDGYKAVLKREPTNKTALQGLVQVQVQLQDFKGAVEPVKKLAELEPNNPEYVIVLAELYLRTNDSAGAKQIQGKIEKLVQEEPNNPQYLLSLAQIYRATNNVSGSLKLEKNLEALVKKGENKAQYLQVLAQVRLQSGNIAGAIETMKELEKIYPEDAKLKEAIARLEASLIPKAPINPIIPSPQISPDNSKVPINPIIPSPQISPDNPLNPSPKSPF